VLPFRYLLDSLHEEMAGGDRGGEREAEEDAQSDSGWSTGNTQSTHLLPLIHSLIPTILLRSPHLTNILLTSSLTSHHTPLIPYITPHSPHTLPHTTLHSPPLFSVAKTKVKNIVDDKSRQNVAKSVAATSISRIFHGTLRYRVCT
jgi:hypothetical protein